MEENKIKGIHLNFQNLSPKDDINLDVYGEALDYAFSNEKVKNIAITGSYGSGKSSLIETYKKKHQEYRFINISLAHFIDKKNDDDISEEVIEGKILNQLLHKIPANQIPQTNFRIKRNYNSKDINEYILKMFISVILAIYTIYFDRWTGYVGSLANTFIKDILNLTVNPYFRIISSCISLFMIYQILIKLAALLKNRTILKKISLKGNEIEVFNEDVSYFDKYLNEVIYLFENAFVDAIVFEDIDRYEKNIIFEKLREISLILNERSNKQIKFFYLLRDDMFISKERTKFFDYIIPVIPVVDSSNSFNQFLEHFKEVGVLDKLDLKYLRGLSLYIDDMRILKNIYNEFLIYYHLLNDIELDSNKMLAIITYKNIFPKDFSDLQLNLGFVYALFMNKEKLIKNSLEDLESKILMKKEEIEYVKKENLVSIEELDYIYKMKDNKAGYNYQEQQKVEEWYKNIYPKRKQAIDNINNNRLQRLEKELHSLKNEYIKIKDSSLKSLINRENIDDYFKLSVKNELGVENKFEEIKESDYFDLLKYLIRNGFIDESYNDYMTYFYDNSLCRDDKIFLRSIADKKRKDYTYKLKEPKLVLENLDSSDFEQEEVLNFDLLIYLLVSENKMIITKVLNQLKENSIYDFIEGFINNNQYIGNFIYYISKVWPEMFSSALKGKELTIDTIKRVAIVCIYNCDEQDLNAVNFDNCLTNYISSTETFLDIENPKIERLIERFKNLNVNFKKINYESSNKELFDAVYKNNLYVLNFENIKQMITLKLKISQDEFDQLKIPTIIMNENTSPLYEYSMKNMNSFIFEIINNVKSIEDEEKVVIEILNANDIENDNKLAYIDLLKTKISKIKLINDIEIQIHLIDKCLIEYSAINILDYYLEIKKIDDTLVKFINLNRNELGLEIIINKYDEEIISAFFEDCVQNTNLSLQKYKEIIISLNYNYDEFEYKDIDEDKMNVLIEENVIRMNSFNLKFIRNEYSYNLMYFIEKNLTEYVELMTEDLIDEDELSNILLWDIDDNIKIKLLKLTKSPFSIIGKNYSDKICKYILENNLSNDDILELFKSYNKFGEDIKESILTIAANNLCIIIDSSKKYTDDFILDLIKCEKINLSRRVDILISIIPQLSLYKVKEYFKVLNLHNYLKLFEPNSKPSFLKDEMNEKILNVLKKQGLIDSFEINENKNGYYKVKKNRKLFNNL